MGQPVPADDLPSAGVAVPASDLPDAGPAPKQSAVTGTPQDSFAASQLGPYEAGLSIGSGMVAQPISGLAGLAGAILPGETGQGANWQQRISNALTYEPRTQRGKSIMDVVGIPGEVVTNIAGKVGERGAEVSPMLGTIGHTSVEALPALIGFRGALKPAPKLTPKQVQAGQAMDAGFRLTPEEMGAGPVARTMASVSGEPRLGKLNTKKNQPLVNDRIASDLGLPPGTELDLDTLARVRRAAGQQYDAVRGIGQVVPDQTYIADLDALGQKYRSAAKDFPELARGDVEQVVNGLKRPNFDANSAVDMIQQLRESASEAAAGRQFGLAKVMRGGSEALEKMLERHLVATGQDPAIIANFRNARTRIAQAHLAEDALIGDNINPRVYADAAREKAPLTGGAREIGKAADKYERSLQKPTNQATSASFWDVALPALWGGIKELALAGVRPGMRSMLSSRPGQFMMDPRTNISGPTQATLGFGSVPSPQEETR